MVLSALLGGCIDGVDTLAQAVRFSPDGKTIVYGWHESAKLEVPLGEPLFYARNEFLHWCHSDRPKRVTILKIHSMFSKTFPLSPVVSLAFSPDSRHLAVVMIHKITMVDLTSGAHWDVTATGKWITSGAWLSDGEIVYVRHRPVEARPERFERLVYRQKVHRPAGEPVLVCRAPGLDMSPVPAAERPMEKWSPAGRCALFVHAYPRGHLSLVDLDKGSVARLPAPEGNMFSVSWRHDGSRAFCLGGAGTAWQPRSCHALLVRPGAGAVLDLSDRFNKTFRPAGSWHLATGWEADGVHVRVSKYRERDFLVRPEPWLVRPADPGVGVPDFDERRAVSPDGMRVAEVLERMKVIVHVLKNPVSAAGVRPDAMTKTPEGIR